MTIGAEGSVTDLLSAYFAPREVTVTCPDAGCRHPSAVAEFQFSTVPDVLVLQIKRFYYVDKNVQGPAPAVKPPPPPPAAMAQSAFQVGNKPGATPHKTVIGSGLLTQLKGGANMSGAGSPAPAAAAAAVPKSAPPPPKAVPNFVYLKLPTAVVLPANITIEPFCAPQVCHCHHQMPCPPFSSL